MGAQAALEARIRSQVPALRHVGSALDMDALLKGAQSIAVPAALVVHLADQPHADEGFTGLHMQRVASRYAVVFVLDNKRGALGNDAIPNLEQLRAAVRQALLGWSPEPELDPVQAGPGGLIDFVNGRVWWGDEFLFDHYWSEQ